MSAIQVNDIKCTGGIANRKWWIVESIKGSFATLRELEWSKDMVNELGKMRRTERTIRSKIKNGCIYDKALGSFEPDDRNIVKGILP